MTTDDDVRAKVNTKILANVLKALDLQSSLMEPILDPRAFGGEVPDGTGLNRLLQTSRQAIDAYLKTVEPKDDKMPVPLSDEERLARVLKLFESPSPQLLEFIAKRLGWGPLAPRTIEAKALEESNATDQKRK